MSNVRAYLQQTYIGGISLYQIATWIFIVAVILLAVLLLIRLLRWVFSQLNQNSATSNTPPANSYTETSGTSDPVQTSERSVRSFMDDESSKDLGTIAPPQESVFHDERDESTTSPVGPDLVASSKTEGPEIPVAAMSSPEPELDIDRRFQVQSSREAQEFTTKQRSWTSRSLFGKPITGAQEELPRVEPSDVPFADRSDYQWGSETFSQFMPETEERKVLLKKDLIEAGYYTPHAYENFQATRWLGLVVPIILFGALLLLAPPAIEWIFLLLLVVGAGLGWALPRMFVRSKAANRRREIENALPDVIDLLNMCVSQGMTLRSALARVSWEIADTYPVMSEELRIVAEQADLSTTEQALTNLNQRVDVPELHSLSSLLIQTERMGTNVSDSLTEYSDSMRSTLQQRADQKANAATFKLLFPTVFCLMPAVYLFLLGPAVVELSDFFQGGGLQEINSIENLEGIDNLQIRNR